MAEGVFPFAKTHCKGERPTRSAVCTSSAPSLAATLLGARRVSTHQGWAGEKSGLFEQPACYSPVVPNVQTSEVLVYHNSFSVSS